jgi:hypothetical protein
MGHANLKLWAEPGSGKPNKEAASQLGAGRHFSPCYYASAGRAWVSRDGTQPSYFF